MMWGSRIPVETIAGWFDQVGEHEQELIAHFNIQRADGTLITIKDRFRAHFVGLTCRYFTTQEDLANIKFHSIFRDNIFILTQLEKYQDGGVLKDLGNFDLYQDESTTDYSSDSATTGNSSAVSHQGILQERNLIEGGLVGNSDAATMSSARDKTRKVIEAKGILTKSENKIMDYLDPNTKSVTQTISLYGGTDRNTIDATNSGNTSGNTNTRGKSKTITTNPYKDRMTYLKLEVPNLANRFLEKFRVMFLC